MGLTVTTKPGMCACECGAQLPIPRNSSTKYATRECAVRGERAKERENRRRDMERAIAKGLRTPPKPRIPTDRVIAIRAARGSFGAQQVAEMHGVSYANVRDIWRGKSYANVPKAWPL